MSSSSSYNVTHSVYLFVHSFECVLFFEFFVYQYSSSSNLQFMKFKLLVTGCMFHVYAEVSGCLLQVKGFRTKFEVYMLKFDDYRLQVEV